MRTTWSLSCAVSPAGRPTTRPRLVAPDVRWISEPHSEDLHSASCCATALADSGCATVNRP